MDHGPNSKIHKTTLDEKDHSITRHSIIVV